MCNTYNESFGRMFNLRRSGLDFQCIFLVLGEAVLQRLRLTFGRNDLFVVVVLFGDAVRNGRIGIGDGRSATNRRVLDIEHHRCVSPSNAFRRRRDLLQCLPRAGRTALLGGLHEPARRNNRGEYSSVQLACVFECAKELHGKQSDSIKDSETSARTYSSCITFTLRTP